METWKNFAFKRSSVKKTLPKGKVNHGNLKKLRILAELFKKKLPEKPEFGRAFEAPYRGLQRVIVVIILEIP